MPIKNERTDSNKARPAFIEMLAYAMAVMQAKKIGTPVILPIKMLAGHEVQ